jgi:NACHT domain
VKTAKIFLLTGVAGAGKTTIAHTVAQRSRDENVIFSCFFFDREVSGRNDPKMLFSTTARNLADQNDDFAQDVASGLDKNRSLVGGSMSFHFAELILKPSQCLPDDMPVVIIIDALDEGSDYDVLTILRDEVPKLPLTFRILVTSRMMTGLNLYLLRKPHVRPWSIDIDESSNLKDIALYARGRLQEVAEWGELADDWPGSLLLNDFISKAGGLFIWVFIVSEYLRESTDPDTELQALLLRHCVEDISAETRMDQVYSTVLQVCPWRDCAFVTGYSLIIGAMMAAKTPLSESALKSLHRHNLSFPVRNCLRHLACLLTNLDKDDTPVKILHLSLKDFLTIRAQSSPTDQKFFLSEKEHSERLGLLCLQVMNEDLEKCRPAIGYLSNARELKGVPEIGEHVVSEGLLYACKFWISHIVKIEIPEASLAMELNNFLSKYIVPWVEISASKGRLHTLLEVRKWLQVSI